MNITLNKEDVKVFLLSAVYRLAVDWAYFNFCTIIYGYYGFDDNRSFLSLFLSWGLFVLLFPFFNSLIHKGNKRISSIILTVLYLVMYIPFTTCVYAGILTTRYMFLNVIYWFLLLSRGLAQLGKKVIPLPELRFGIKSSNQLFLLAIGIFSLGLVVFVWGMYGGFRLNFNVFDVYDVRLKSREYNMSVIITYMFKWTRAINPILLAYCLVNKKKLASFLFLFAQLLSFNVDGLKSALFMPFVVIIAVCFYHKISVEKTKYWMLLGLTGFSVLGIFEKLLLHSSYIIELFIRRLSILTNYICDCYSRFFSENSPDYFRGTLLKLFGFESPYYDIGKIIGNKYILDGMNCNSGLFSDAIANLGVVGCFVMPFVVIEVLHIIDRSSVHIDRRITIASGLYMSYLFISSFLSTALITHGILVSILTFWLINDAQGKVENEI